MAPTAEQLRDLWRRTGADLPGGDPRPSHGAEMEGYFWRITDVARGTVVLALCGVNRDADGGRWATVAVSAHPAGITRSAVVEEATDDPHHLDVRAGTTLRASADRLVVELDDVALDVSLGPTGTGTGVLPGGGVAGIVPGLGQYWHPHLLGAPASGKMMIGATTHELDGVAYAEKNWGRGFPERWWWGQADGFERTGSGLTVAFGGGRLTTRVAGREVGTDVTGIVCALDGRIVRLAPPLARVTAEVDHRAGRWRVHGRGPRTEITIDGDGSHREPAVLPVPLPAERRNVDTDLEHLAATLHLTVRRDGRTLVEDTSHLAALEVGWRPGSQPDGLLGPLALPATASTA